MTSPHHPSTASLVVGTVLLGTMGAALATVSLDDKLGSTEDDIRAALTAQGYTVLEFEVEGGDLEVEVSLDGREMEIGIDATSGMVLEMELVTDDDD